MLIIIWLFTLAFGLLLTFGWLAFALFVFPRLLVSCLAFAFLRFLFFASGLSLFLFQCLAESVQLRFGKLQCLCFIAQYTLGSFFYTLLQVFHFAPGLIAEGLGRLAEITLAKLVDQLLLIGVLFHDLIQVA